VNLPFDRGSSASASSFLELMASPSRRRSRYFFFAEREAAKIPDVPPDTPAKEIKTRRWWAPARWAAGSR